MWRYFLKIVFIVIVAVFSFSQSATASKVEIMNDVPVDSSFPSGPTSFPLEMERGETITRTIQVDNRFGKERKFKVQVEDFQGSTDDPSQTVLLQGDKSGRYSAKDWVKPELMEFTSNHAERTYFDVTVHIPESADSGDHYASVLISAEPDVKEGDIDTTKPNVRITSRVGILFFIRVRGDIVEDGRLESFQNKDFWYESTPVNFRTIYKNDGSVRIRPYGEITITNMFGSVEDILQIEPYNVLRNSVRSMTHAWDTKKFLIGKYEASIVLRNGFNDTIETKTVEFWIVPWKILTAILFGFVMVGFGIRYLKNNVELKIKK